MERFIFHGEITDHYLIVLTFNIGHLYTSNEQINHAKMYINYFNFTELARETWLNIYEINYVVKITETFIEKLVRYIETHTVDINIRQQKSKKKNQ